MFGGGYLVVFVDLDVEFDNVLFVDVFIGVIDDYNFDLLWLFKVWGVVYDDCKVVFDCLCVLKIELGDISFSYLVMFGLGG